MTQRPLLFLAAMWLSSCGIVGGDPDKPVDGDDDDDDIDVVDDCSDEDQWVEDFIQIMCDESELCGDGSMAGMWCDPPTSTAPTTTTGANCAYDPVQACACLDGTYTCNTDLTGFEFVEPPDACLAVYTCR